MKSLLRWSAILGLVGTSLIGPSLARQTSALALPEKQVLEILNPVPLFMITNQEGQPLAATVPNPQDKTKQIQVYSFFVSQQDAQQVVNSLKTGRPEVGKIAKITPTSLSGVVKFAMDGKKQNSNVGIEIIPNRQQLDSAVAMLKQDGDVVDKGGQLVTKDGKPFRAGTPLFFVADSKTGGPIAVETNVKQNGQDKKVRFVPFYFSKQELQTELEQAKKQRPELGTSTKIEVIMLDTLVSTLYSNNDPVVGQFQLVPTRESIEFIMKQQPAGQTPARTAPQAAPAPKSK